MSKNEAELMANWSETALGKLKLKMAEIIMSRPGVIPPPEAVRHFILAEYKKNPMVGFIFLQINALNSMQEYSYAQTKVPDNLGAYFKRFAQLPNRHPYFVEIKNCPKPFPTAVGVLIEVDETADKHHAITLTAIDPNHIPEYIIGKTTFELGHKGILRSISSLGANGWIDYDPRRDRLSQTVHFALRALSISYEDMPLIQVSVDEATPINPQPSSMRSQTPVDPILDNLLADLNSSRTFCTAGVVNLDLITPHSVQFCLTYPPKLIELTAEQIRSGVVFPLLVYWKGTQFIMSDDYGVYLAHKKLRSQTVSVVILGSYPNQLVNTERHGGKELLPKVVLLKDVPTEFTSNDIDRLLGIRHLPDNVAHLYAIYMAFCQILAHPNSYEKNIHRFILQNPDLIEPHRSEMHSEVQLGKKYRIDIVLQYQENLRRIKLVELESAKHEIFTKQGRLQAHITHALTQVEDWLRWWRENQDLIPVQFDRTLVPEGCVIVGRGRDFTDEQRKTFAGLNATREIKLMTYDDLLDQLESLISSLEKLP